jgi:ribosomal protein S18 acetylase RimI-like enzyme
LETIEKEMIIQVKTYEFFTSPEFVAFATDSLLEVKYQELGITFKPEKIGEEFLVCIDNPDRVCFAAMDGPKVVGILLCNVSKMIFSDTPIAEQLYARVDKDYRGKGIYSDMFKCFYVCAKEKGAAVILVGSHDNTDLTQAATIAYDKMGFKPFHESYYIKL